jgi:hypothetical protein
LTDIRISSNLRLMLWVWLSRVFLMYCWVIVEPDLAALRHVHQGAGDALRVDTRVGPEVGVLRGQEVVLDVLGHYLQADVLAVVLTAQRHLGAVGPVVGVALQLGHLVGVRDLHMGVGVADHADDRGEAQQDQAEDLLDRGQPVPNTRLAPARVVEETLRLGSTTARHRVGGAAGAARAALADGALAHLGAGQPRLRRGSPLLRPRGAARRGSPGARSGPGAAWGSAPLPGRRRTTASGGVASRIRLLLAPMFAHASSCSSNRPQGLKAVVHFRFATGRRS